MHTCPGQEMTWYEPYGRMRLGQYAAKPGFINKQIFLGKKVSTSTG